MSNISPSGPGPLLLPTTPPMVGPEKLKISPLTSMSSSPATELTAYVTTVFEVIYYYVVAFKARPKNRMFPRRCCRRNIFEGAGSTTAVTSAPSQESRPSKTVKSDHRKWSDVYNDVAFKDGRSPSLNADDDLR